MGLYYKAGWRDNFPNAAPVQEDNRLNLNGPFPELREVDGHCSWLFQMPLWLKARDWSRHFLKLPQLGDFMNESHGTSLRCKAGTGLKMQPHQDVSTPSVQSRLLASFTPSFSDGEQDTEVLPMWSMVKNIFNEHNHSKAPCDPVDVNPVSEVNLCSEIYDRLSTYFSLVPPN